MKTWDQYLLTESKSNTIRRLILRAVRRAVPDVIDPFTDPVAMGSTRLGMMLRRPNGALSVKTVARILKRDGWTVLQGVEYGTKKVNPLEFVVHKTVGGERAHARLQHAWTSNDAGKHIRMTYAQRLTYPDMEIGELDGTH